MHFGIDASRLAVGKRTGTENYAFHVTKGLLQQAKSRHRFTLYFNQLPAPNLLYDLGLPPSATPRMMPFPRLWTHLRLSQEMVRAAPDLLFVPAHVLPLIHPARSVVTLHDLGYLYFPQAHTPAARRYLDFSTRFSASQAQKIIAVSQATKADLVRHYNIPPEKIRVVYHGYDQKRFRPLANLERLAAVQERYHLKPSPYLLYVGTLQPRKNLSRLIEAFASLIGDPALDYPHREQLQLILGGQPGWWSNPLVEMVKNLKLENRIIFTGYLADEDLPVLLSHATAFVLPSLYEGFGMGVIEAMACGTPVICSNAGSLPEVAGNAALLHHPLDRLALEWNLRRLLTNAGLREDLAQKGLLQASRFSWEQSAAETLEVLESLG
ncbi:MAG: glycosyltransferase family 1 protein [Chloroflexota bacterium]